LARRFSSASSRAASSIARRRAMPPRDAARADARRRRDGRRAIDRSRTRDVDRSRVDRRAIVDRRRARFECPNARATPSARSQMDETARIVRRDGE
jgi:hypothetical protein